VGRQAPVALDRSPGAVGGRPRAAGRVENQVAGICGHQEAALDQLRRGFNDVFLVGSIASDAGVVPKVVQRESRKVIDVSDVPGSIANEFDPIRMQ
jgi:hypothetical protein